MKRFLALFIMTSALVVAEPFEEVSFFEEEAVIAPSRPFGINGTYLNIAEAAPLDEDFDSTGLRYRQSDAAFAFTYPCTPYSGFILGIGWVGTEVAMNNNPLFDETEFNYISFSLGGFSRSFCDWLWTLSFSALVDTQAIDLGEYALYQGTIWGKYTPDPCWEIDLGVITEIGLHKEKFWPILGFVYNYSPTLSLHLVYPIDVSIEKDFFDCISLCGCVRFIRNRHRVGADNILPKAIFEYRATGIEIDLGYSPPSSRFGIEGFVGTTLQGDLKVTNENNHDPRYFRFEGSFYAGVTAQLSF